MGSMYPSKKLNVALFAMGLFALAVCWALIRGQTAIADRQFLRSMIPHHAGAILMCKEAPIADAEVRDLCRRIIAGQESEIREMEAKLARR